MDTPEKPAPKKRARYVKRVDAHENLKTVLALSASGLSQVEIARKTGLSAKTVNRHVAQVKQTLNETRSIVNDVADELAKIQTPAQIAKRIVDLGEDANNEAVSLGALQWNVELRGGITEKERLRKQGEGSGQPAPMFVLPAGAMVNVSVTTTSSKDAPDNGATERCIDVTPR